jgi:type IV secretory pathway ATPase VirB11/archaellum biosynthesis ATPase
MSKHSQRSGHDDTMMSNQGHDNMSGMNIHTSISTIEHKKPKKVMKRFSHMSEGPNKVIISNRHSAEKYMDDVRLSQQYVSTHESQIKI